MAAELPVGGPHQERAVELKLPSGVRFRPYDEQIVDIYLRNEANGGPCVIPGFKIPELDVYGMEPWLLRPLANTRFSVAGEFYCFARMKRSSAKDGRLQRRTPSGCWKASGARQPVPEKCTGRPCVGFRMQLKYFSDAVDNVGSGGTDKKATATAWVMHEYRLPPSFWEAAPADVGELVMCRISPTGSGVAIGEAPESSEKPSSSSMPCLPDGVAPQRVPTVNELRLKELRDD